MEIIKNRQSSTDLYGRRFGFFVFGLSTALFSTGLKSDLPEDTVPEEYQVKAVFLFNFIQFAEWPESAFPEQGSPFNICIFGEDPFGGYLKEVVQDEVIRGHPLRVMHHDEQDEINGCHILFVGKSEAVELKKVLSRLYGKTILTVGETKGFGQMGGMIEFVKRENKIRLKINQKAAEDSRLEISSKLLRLAEIVSTENSP